LVIFLPKKTYIHRIYRVPANPTNECKVGWPEIQWASDLRLHAALQTESRRGVRRVGQNHTYIRIYGVYVFLAGKSPYIRPYTVCIHTVLANPRHMIQKVTPVL
jgi:hypothetical protein